MNLTDRKIKILEAIIKDYIINAEAVGSRTISKKYDLGVSAATIRNEMSDLEEMGYLIQPHTSAGRIPSEKGYKLYVNSLMKEGQLDEIEKDIIKKSIIENIGEVKDLLEETLKLLSKLTNCTSLALKPKIVESKIRHLKLVYINSTSILLVVITDTGLVKNTILNNVLEISEDKVNIISKVLNDKLVGKVINELDENFVKYIRSQMIEYSNILDNIFESVLSNLIEIDDLEVLLNGATNIFNFPEFNDIVKAKAFLNMLEEKQIVANVLNTKGIEKNHVNIVIGSDNYCETIKDCSVITATCDIDGVVIGKIGIIGPTRMDYSKIYSVINYMGNILRNSIKKKLQIDNKG
ncbi:heat-inducible transcriptional repressor HrcA [Tepidibacter thalassicus]|uniref:Heat-inducible transcription repressor HrcA n=1 Tax=Tepidibacter thalassicus DSM 15285 TaxID=1123350 RepID=A0A1M5NII4_9FIRM|nr:heat-inducible transcriptional repressor HrcA [Tepidibacter thalassicus]SHG89302.1 heat-inducible transcription repressor HrcA [Tepidibacter thalassicus DSM 15285]